MIVSILTYYCSWKKKKASYDPVIHFMPTIHHNLQFENPGPHDLYGPAFANRNNLQVQRVVNRTLSRTQVAF